MVVHQDSSLAQERIVSCSMPMPTCKAGSEDRLAECTRLGQMLKRVD